MKFPPFLLGIVLLSISQAGAQMEIPSNPRVGPNKNTTRSSGGTLDPGASIDGVKGPAMVKHVTHVLLCQPRVWTNQQGKPVQAPLIAFEDLTAESPKGSPPPKMPAPPVRPTLVKNGKIRLLVNQKPAEVAVASLSAGDQEYVEIIKGEIEKKAAAAK